MRNAIILAAGKGSRMKSLREDISKVSFPILGQPLLQYVFDALAPLHIDETVAVLGFGSSASERIVGDQAKIVIQHEQKGSGHAVMMAAPLLEGKEGITIVCCGDTPLLRAETLEEMFKVHEENKDSMTVMTSHLDNPFGYGRIVKKNGRVIKIVEQKDASESEKLINEVNAGVYIFDNKALFESLHGITTNNAAGEYYLTDVLSIFVSKGLKVGSYQVKDQEETLGINDRSQLSKVAKIMQHRINEKLMLSGVTMEDPDSTFIGPRVEIGPDTTICPNTHLRGECKIGTNNLIGPNSYFENVEIGNDNEIIFSHLADTKVGNHTSIGPFFRSRKGVIIHDGAHIGNFNEFKNVEFGEGAKCAHLSYLGDAKIGDRVNIGCGTIIANYDGVNKWHTEIGNDVFVGSGSTIISPVTVGDEAFIAAGSTINYDVDPGEMAIARARQENKPGYAKKLKEKALEKKQK